MLDIHFVCKEIKELYQEFDPLKQKKLYISVEVEGNALFFFINLSEGKLDLLIEPENTGIEVHKNKFKVKLVENPLFKAVI